MTEVHPREDSAAPAPRRPGEKPPRNPYLVIIAAMWIGALALGLLMVLRSTVIDEQSVAAELATAGAWSLGVAGVVALVHLAVKAILWREGDDNR